MKQLSLALLFTLGSLSAMVPDDDTSTIESALLSQIVVPDSKTNDNSACIDRTTHPIIYSEVIIHNPDGTQTAHGLADGTIRINDAATGNLEHEIQAHSVGWVHSLAYSPDGSELISAAYDFTPKLNWLMSKSHDPLIRVWDTATGERKAYLFYPNEINNLIYSPDGRFIASSSMFCIQIWNAKTRQLLRELKTPIYYSERISFSSDGNTLTATFYDTTQTWDMKNFNTVQKWLSDVCPPIPSRDISEKEEEIIASPIAITALIQKILHPEKARPLTKIKDWICSKKEGVLLSNQEIELFGCLPKEVREALIDKISNDTSLFSDDDDAIIDALSDDEMNG